MARPKMKPKTENATSEQAGVEGPPLGSPPSRVSKAEAVRRALAAGKESPDDGVGFIRSRYGIDMTKQMFSSYKSQAKARSARQAESTADDQSGWRKAVDGYLAPPPRPATPGDQADLLAALEAMKPLVDRLGVDQVKRIAELLG